VSSWVISVNSPMDCLWLISVWVGFFCDFTKQAAGIGSVAIVAWNIEIYRLANFKPRHLMGLLDAHLTAGFYLFF